MELRLVRDVVTPSYTLGKMFIGNEFFCYTVEDTVRDRNNDGDLNDSGETKVYGETAIPKGVYKVIINMSNRFKRLLPLLLNVPGFEGIRIHPGNKAVDSHGCILVGTVRAPDGVLNSKICFERLMKRLEVATEINITIE